MRYKACRTAHCNVNKPLGLSLQIFSPMKRIFIFSHVGAIFKSYWILLKMTVTFFPLNKDLYPGVLAL